MVISKNRLKITKLILSSTLLMISILVIGNLCKDCFFINNYSQTIVFACVICGIFVHIVLSRFLKKWWHKAIFIIMLILSFMVLYKVNKYFYYDFYKHNILEPINYMVNCYNYNKIVDFKIIKPLIRFSVPILSVLILYIVEKCSVNFIVLINGVALICVWALENWLLQKYMFKLIGLSFVTIIINQVLKNSKKNIDKYEKIEITWGNTCWIIIPVIFILITSFYVSSTKGGILSENNIISEINEYVYGNGSVIYGDQSVLNKVGYNNSTDILGGSISLDDKVVMYVDTDRPCYLRGNIKEEYSGYSWRAKNSYGKLEPNLHLKNLEPKTSMTIKYAGDFKTYNFFVPNNYVKIQYSNPDGIRYSKKGEVLNNTFVNEPYTVVKYDSIGAKDFLYFDSIDDVVLGQAPRYMDYQVSVLSRYNSSETMDDFIYDKYDETIKFQYNDYLQLPKMPSRVIELSDSITKNCNSTYGKVQAIKKYLEDNYTYSLKVDVPNRDKDFVDNFLFEEKKGYCTYFASAMAILCRAQGIPARYVEGFSMNNAEKRKNEYIVTSKCAHAWCEVLASPEKNLWTIVDPKTSINSDRPVINDVPINEIHEQEKEEDKEKLKDQIEKKNQNENKKTQNGVSNEVGNKHKTFYEKYLKEFNLFTLTLCALLIVGIVAAGVYSVRGIRYMRIMKDKSLKSLYKYYVKKLNAMGIVYEEGETDLEFMRKTRDTEIYPYCMELVEKLNGELYGGMVGELDRKKYYKFINRYYKQNSKTR
ncbi:Transglutaminase-like enzyme, putative cysteine protease [Hathewaya proteolytica DSM 3090]|uniref:Transglutaminase-like enzyme, putative cysteine protease n=1 Tax=Hathewaya proteolytica DSM 3090 TaxID=1121331 RepID=A0A1M6T7G4_9CLOT|nr:transglutaminase domain-containing protein [Hathewaya proteolytica]SHK52931.1 Transglutaminase-like enzyme, putative cysteine protease [Hathewaya proteolytica DSM 3090]